MSVNNLIASSSQFNFLSKLMNKRVEKYILEKILSKIYKYRSLKLLLHLLDLQ